MAYTTITFLIFALITILMYFAFSKKEYQWVVLLVASYVFYLWANWRFAYYLLITTVTIYLAGLFMDKIGNEGKAEVAAHKKEWDRTQKKQYKEIIKKKRRRILVGTLVLNFGILVFLKYCNFFSFNLILPLGISFYTFQSTGYVIDVYREKIGAERNLAKFALFV